LRQSGGLTIGQRERLIFVGSKIHSNDPDSPVVEAELTGNGQ